MEEVNKIIFNELGGWKSVQLKDVATYINTKIATSDLILKNYISTENMNVNRGGVVSSSNVPTNIKVNKFQKNDILFSNIRTYFKKLWRAEFDGGASNDVLIIRTLDIEKIKNNYLYYVLSQEDFFEHTIKTSKGTKMPRGDKEAIMKYEFLIPENIETQEKIASILSSLDDKIELNNQMNKTLEDMAQTIFKRWFIDFEFPNENGEPYKSSGGKMVESELGDIPEGWEIGIYCDLVELKTLNTKKGDHLAELPYVPIDCLPRKSLGLKEFKSWKEAESSLQLFDENDILFGAMRAYFHKVVISPFRGITRKTCFVLRPLDNLDLSFITLLTFQDSTIDYANSNSKGTTMPYAVWDNGLNNMKIIIPKRKIREEFNLQIYYCLDKIKNNLLFSQKIIEIRDTLLPKLMSGEIQL